MSTPDTSNRAREIDMSDQGFWIDRTICGFLQEGSREFPDKVAVVARRTHERVVRRITYGALEKLVERAAHGLSSLGIRHGDVVSIQLPNCWQFVVAALACVRVGATVNPMVPILREREVRHMVAFARSKLLIVPHVHRGFDHAAMAEVLRAEIDTLEAVIVVKNDDDDDFHRILLGEGRPVAPTDPSSIRRLEPNDLLVLMYTSGTTGEPKGVMHTSNTVNGNLLAVARKLNLDSADVFLTASPMGTHDGLRDADDVAADARRDDGASGHLGSTRGGQADSSGKHQLHGSLHTVPGGRLRICFCRIVAHAEDLLLRRRSDLECFGLGRVRPVGSHSLFGVGHE